MFHYLSLAVEEHRLGLVVPQPREDLQEWNCLLSLYRFGPFEHVDELMIKERKKRHLFICWVYILNFYLILNPASLKSASLMYLLLKTRFLIICWCFYFLQRRVIMTKEELEDTYYLIIWSQLASYYYFFNCRVLLICHAWVQTMTMMVWWWWQRKY